MSWENNIYVGSHVWCGGALYTVERMEHKWVILISEGQRIWAPRNGMTPFILEITI